MSIIISLLVIVWYKYVTNILQIYYRYITNTLQTHYKYCYKYTYKYTNKYTTKCVVQFQVWDILCLDDYDYLPANHGKWLIYDFPCHSIQQPLNMKSQIYVFWDSGICCLFSSCIHCCFDGIDSRNSHSNICSSWKCHVSEWRKHRHWHLEAWSNWGTEGHANETKQRQGKLEKYKKAETKEMSCRIDSMSLQSRARPFTEHQCNGGFSAFPQ